MTDANSLFLPSAEAARAIDANIRARLRESLPWLAESFTSLDVEPAETEEWFAQPVDFGFYYDLASAKHHDGEPIASDAIQANARRLADSVSCGRGAAARVEKIAIKNLSDEFYDAREIDCLVRWFDLEPENRMALLPLEPEEFDAAKRNLTRALEFIRVRVPECHGELEALTTEFVFAKPGSGAKLSFGGASSFALWGAVALNGQAHPHWFEYIPRVVHEYSHNLLFGLAADEALVENDPEERYKSPLRGTLRPIDGIYHACYVSARETYLMDRVLSSDEEDSTRDEKALSAYAREYRLRSQAAYNDCAIVLREHARPTALGKRILEDVAAYMYSRQAPTDVGHQLS